MHENVGPVVDLVVFKHEHFLGAIADTAELYAALGPQIPGEISSQPIRRRQTPNQTLVM